MIESKSESICSGCGKPTARAFVHHGMEYCVDCYLNGGRSKVKLLMVMEKSQVEDRTLRPFVSDDAQVLVYGSESAMLGDFLEHCLFGGQDAVGMMFNDRLVRSDV